MEEQRPSLHQVGREARERHEAFEKMVREAEAEEERSLEPLRKTLDQIKRSKRKPPRKPHPRQETRNPA